MGFVTGGCGRFMKYTLVVFNILVFIVGAIAIGLGVWSLVGDFGADEIKSITGNNFYEGACIAVIVGGCIICTIALLGAVGAMCENRILLGIYFVIMLLMLILFVVAAVVGFFFRDVLTDELDKEMEASLKDRYGIDVDKSDLNKDVTEAWNLVQQRLECCGVKGDRNSSYSWYFYQSTKWYHQNLTSSAALVPSSCCNKKINSYEQQCQYMNFDLNTAPQMVKMSITKDNEALYEDGCLDRLESEIKDHIIAIGAIAIVVIIIMFLSILFAILVCVEIGRNKQDIH